MSFPELSVRRCKKTVARRSKEWTSVGNITKDLFHSKSESDMSFWERLGLRWKTLVSACLFASVSLVFCADYYDVLLQAERMSI